MINLPNTKVIREFYESIGGFILHIERRNISEAEKEKSYLLVDNALKMLEDHLKCSLRLVSELGRGYERAGDIRSGLEGIEEGLDESRADLENFELALEIFGVRPFYSERGLGVSGR